MVPDALNFRLFVVSWCFLRPPQPVLQLIWAVVVPHLFTLSPALLQGQPGQLCDMAGCHWKNLPEDPACAGPALEQEALGFYSPMVDMVACQLHLLFGAQMLLCKCSCSQGPAASSPFPVENTDEIMSLGCSADEEAGVVGTGNNTDGLHYPVLTALRTNSLSLECPSMLEEVISLCPDRFHFTVSLIHGLDLLRAWDKVCV